MADLGFHFLGSRMKRVAERMHAQAGKNFEANGHGRLSPALKDILATLDRQQKASIGQLVISMRSWDSTIRMKC